MADVVAECGLSAHDLAQVRGLADEVRRADGVNLKLNWDLMARHVPNQASDFCCYENGQLVGYAPLDGEGRELEVTAAVVSSFRRRGIFRLLLRAPKQEAQRRGAERLLLVNYRASQSGRTAALALNLPYVFSEYHMEAEAAGLPPLQSGQVQLVKVGEANLAALAQMMALNFSGERHSPQVLAEELQEADTRYFLAELDGVQIGQIGVVDEQNSIYVRAVGVIPNYRRRGYGRQLVAAILQTMLLEGHTRFALDVATDNVQALSLYKACGFCEADVYDYYDVPLTEAKA